MNPYIYTGLPEKTQYYSRHGITVSEPSEIIHVVSTQLGVTYGQITSSSRLRIIAEARCIAIGLISIAQPNLTLKQIGKMFGNRDHSTIIYSKALFFDLYSHNPPFRIKVDLVKEITNMVS